MKIDRLMSVLETISVAGRPISATDLESMTGIPRPTCYRLLHTLAEHRFLDETDQKSRFVIGRHLVQVALLAKSDAGLSGAVSPVLKEAAARFGEATFLSRFSAGSVSIIHVETPDDGVTPYIHPGLGKRPLHACSCSKAIAAFASDEFREKVLNGPLKAYTENTAASREAVAAEFEKIKVKGYAECVEEIERGVSSVAAPVKIANAGTLFSVGTIGSIVKFDEKHREVRGNQLISIAEKVSALIQFNGQF